MTIQVMVAGLSAYYERSTLNQLDTGMMGHPGARKEAASRASKALYQTMKCGSCPYANPDRIYMTPIQVAARLQIHVEYLYRHLLGQPSGIPAIKVGKGPRARWRISLASLEQWEAQQQVCYRPGPTGLPQ